MALSNSEKSRRWREKYPEKRKLDNARRRKRLDRRDCTVWHKRVRLLRLHSGELHRRPKDWVYDEIEVLLTPLELAKIWFRDKAYLLYKPHLDRIDPKGHYEFDNVRFIEDYENYARRTIREEVPF